MSRFDHRSSQSGASLIESLIASALLLFIAVAVFPMFHRSVASNISGSDSSEASQHGRSELERLLALPIDSQVFDMRNPLPDHVIQSGTSGDRMVLGSFFYDPKANTSSQSTGDLTHRIGSGAWVTQQSVAKGLVLWQRTSEIRQYSYNDISDCSVATGDTSTCISTGHPHLFDTPLPASALPDNVNFKLEEISIQSVRPGTPPFRARVARTY